MDTYEYEYSDKNMLPSTDEIFKCKIPLHTDTESLSLLIFKVQYHHEHGLKTPYIEMPYSMSNHMSVDSWIQTTIRLE